MDIRRIIKEEIEDFDWIQDTVPDLDKEWTDWMVSGLMGDDKRFAYYVTFIKLLDGLVSADVIKSLKQRVIINGEEPSKVFCKVIDEILKQNRPGEFTKMNTRFTEGDKNELMRFKKVICKKSLLKRVLGIKESEDLEWIKDEPLIDLRNAEFGDILLSSHGAVLMYVGPLPEDDYYDHEVVSLKIPESSSENPSGNHYDEVINLEPLSWTDRPKRYDYKYGGSRVHSGHSFRKNRMPDYDHDIVEVIPREQFDTKTLTESTDFDWMDSDNKRLTQEEYVGKTFKLPGWSSWDYAYIERIFNHGGRDVVEYYIDNRNPIRFKNNAHRGTMEITTLEEKIDSGQWVMVTDVNESKDF
jgi:hypothetical protein